jgi:hypothetical protein
VAQLNDEDITISRLPIDIDSLDMRTDAMNKQIHICGGFSYQDESHECNY